MLKTLRVTSLAAVVLAVIGVAAIAVLGLKGDPEIRAFLERKGIVDSLREKADEAGIKEDKSSPLVALAKKMALRFNPPPPPKPVVKSPKPDPKLERKKTPPKIPQKKVQAAVKSDLLATVLYESSPEKSMALFKAGAKQEWFRQGEKVGHLEIREIRDGSVLFSQGGQAPKEIFVPLKPRTKSLLKNSSPRTSAVQSSITTGAGSSESTPAAVTDVPTAATPPKATTTDSNKIRLTRPSVSDRLKARSPSPAPIPSPQEQKKKFAETMSGIETIMKREDESLSQEERDKENELWMRLLKALNAEKASLEKTAEEAASADPNMPR
ncbi:MAG: hypothetical protein ACYSOF_01435 [Planctomycetota bacterium]|jgi:hypothetical protein